MTMKMIPPQSVSINGQDGLVARPWYQFLTGINSTIGLGSSDLVADAGSAAAAAQAAADAAQAAADTAQTAADAAQDAANAAQATADTALTAALLSDTHLRSISVENPIANDNFALCHFQDAVTITQLSFVLVGTTNATVFVSFGPDRSVLGTDVITAGTVVSNTTTGHIVTTFDDATIPADSWVAIRVIAISGLPDELHITAAFTYDVP